MCLPNSTKSTPNANTSFADNPSGNGVFAITSAFAPWNNGNVTETINSKMAITLVIMVTPAKVITQRAILSCRLTLRIRDLLMVCTAVYTYGFLLDRHSAKAAHRTIDPMGMADGLHFEIA